MSTKLSQHAEFKLFELLFSFLFYFFPLCSWTSECGRGNEQLKPKLSSSVLYQMAITRQLFFSSIHSANIHHLKFAKRGRGAWGSRAQIINLELLKLSEYMSGPLYYSFYLTFGKFYNEKIEKQRWLGVAQWKRERTVQVAESLGADPCSFTLAMCPWVSFLTSLCSL